MQSPSMNVLQDQRDTHMLNTTHLNDIEGLLEHEMHKND